MKFLYAVFSLALLLLANSASSTPLYYDFEVPVLNRGYDLGCAVGSQGWSWSEEVLGSCSTTDQYYMDHRVYKIDASAQDPNHSDYFPPGLNSNYPYNEDYPDSVDPQYDCYSPGSGIPALFDYYSVSYVGGSVFDKFGSPFANVGEGENSSCGLNRIIGGGVTFETFKFVQDLSIGDGVNYNGWEIIYDGSTYLRSGPAQLVSISQDNPLLVPEPSAMTLELCGLSLLFAGFYTKTTLRTKEAPGPT